MAAEIRPMKGGFFPQVVFEKGDVFLGNVALGNMTQYRIMLMLLSEHRLFVAIESVGAYEFDSQPHVGYLMEKLGLRHDGDAMNIVDLIRDQFRGDGPPAARKGRYDESLCR